MERRRETMHRHRLPTCGYLAGFLMMRMGYKRSPLQIPPELLLTPTRHRLVLLLRLTRGVFTNDQILVHVRRRRRAHILPNRLFCFVFRPSGHESTGLYISKRPLAILTYGPVRSTWLKPHCNYAWIVDIVF